MGLYQDKVSMNYSQAIFIDFVHKTIQEIQNTARGSAREAGAQWAPTTYTWMASINWINMWINTD